MWWQAGLSALAVGLATWAVVATAATPTQPGAPAGLIATPGDSQVTLSWQAPSDNGSPITRYTVTISPGTTQDGATTTMTVTGLTNGTAYTFSVTATNIAGTGLPSNTATATPHAPPSPPGAPINLTVTPGDRQVSLSWSPPTSTGSSPIVQYTVKVTPGPQTITTNTTNALVGSLTNKSTYTFTVTATNTEGTGPGTTVTATPSNGIIGLQPAAGGKDTQITVSGQEFPPNQVITVYWDDPSRAAGSATSDSNGAFSVGVKPFPGDAPGVHRLFANVPPNPHADFTLQGPPTPTPPASPTPSDSPSPSPSESPSASSSRTDSPSPPPATSGAISGFDIITRPPFVFLPIIGALGLLGVIGYWALSGTRRNRTSALPASVVHRSFRPDYGAPIGGPVAPAGAAAAPLPEPIPPVPPPAAEAPPTVEPQAPEPAPPVEPFAPASDVPPPAPPELPGAPDAPPDLPVPSD